jgi:hypothetical protein
VNQGRVGRPPGGGGQSFAGGQDFGPSPTAFGSGVAGHNQPGQVQPVNYGEGAPFIQWVQSGRPTGGGMPNVNFQTTGQSPLAAAQIASAINLAETADPEALRQGYYQRGENAAIRAGQAALQAQLRDIAGQGAMTGFGPASGFVQAARRSAIGQSGAQRMQALENLQQAASTFGEQAALGRLAAGTPIEQLDLQRRMENTGILNQQQLANARAAASRSAAAAAGYERSYLMTDPATGQQMYMPESYINFLTQFA